MSERYADLVRALEDSVLTGPGVTAATLRRAVYTRAAATPAAAAAAPGPDEPAIPAELESLVGKVVERAYEVTDRDVAELRDADYSEDAIFEVAVSAALGAGLTRLERGLTALGNGRVEGDNAP